MIPRAITSVLMLFLGLILGFQSAAAQSSAPRFEVGPVFSIYHAPLYLESTQFQLGGRFTWNWLPHLALESEYASALKSPVDATNFEGGYFSQALFGIKSGVRFKSWGVFGKFRPGFIRYSSAISGGTTTSTGITFTRAPLRDAAFDLGGGAEFFMSRHFLFRYDAGDLVVHEGPSSYLSNGQKFPVPSFTVNNFEAEVGVAFRF